jgi:transcriptional regulator with XRE-family HTH domain
MVSRRLALQMGVSHAYISKLEKAGRISPKVLRQVAAGLAISRRPRRILRETGTSVVDGLELDFWGALDKDA